MPGSVYRQDREGDQCSRRHIGGGALVGRLRLERGGGGCPAEQGDEDHEGQTWPIDLLAEMLIGRSFEPLHLVCIGGSFSCYATATRMVGELM